MLQDLLSFLFQASLVDVLNWYQLEMSNRSLLCRAIISIGRECTELSLETVDIHREAGLVEY